MQHWPKCPAFELGLKCSNWAQSCILAALLLLWVTPAKTDVRNPAAVLVIGGHYLSCP